MQVTLQNLLGNDCSLSRPETITTTGDSPHVRAHKGPMHADLDSTGAMRDVYACMDQKVPAASLADHCIAQRSAHTHSITALTGAVPLLCLLHLADRLTGHSCMHAQALS